MDRPDRIVLVDLPGRAYPIQIAGGLLDRTGSMLRESTKSRRACVVTDTNVEALHAPRLLDSLASAGLAVTCATIPAGEAAKGLPILAELYDVLAEDEHGRGDPIVALGGGAVGDVAGLLAATWMRGVPWVVCPTTLEAMVDASLGGKTAINHAAGKNLIGAFHQPTAVLIDPDCLQTLDGRTFRAGLSESVKHAAVADAEFLDWQKRNAGKILERDGEIIAELIDRNCQIKAAIVVADERERWGEAVGRAALNFGHTIGHALELQAEFGLLHGEAVALGMAAELNLAVRCLDLPREEAKRVEGLLEMFGLPTRLDTAVNLEQVIGAMRLDKKARGGAIRFVVPEVLGRPAWLAMPSVEVVAAVLSDLVGATPTSRVGRL